MIEQPFLVVVDVVECCSQLVVGKPVVWEILYDNVFQFLKLAFRVAMVFREDVDIVARRLFSAEKCFDVWEQGLFFVLHVKPYVVGILIVETQDESGKPVAFLE